MLVIYFLIFLSGFSALLFQITAQKYLSIYLGSDSLSTTLVLSLFFFFLSLGYWVWGKLGHKISKNNLLTYGYIELGIGLYYLGAPTLFYFLFNLFSNWEFHFWNSLLLSSLYLFVPCFLMGGSLPVCIQAISRNLKESDSTHSMTYAINTIGAFAGSFFCGFYLIESFGLRLSLTLAGAINCFIYIVIVTLKAISKKNYTGYTPNAKSVASLSWSILALSFLGGFTTFAFESIMIRITALSVGGSTYAYTIIVSCFIFAIGCGAFIYDKIYRNTDVKNLQKLLVFTFLSLICIYWLVPHTPNILMRFKLLINSSEFNFMYYWVGIFILFLFLLIVPVILLGLNLPVLFSLHKNENKYINESVGSLYMLNAIGSMAGALSIFGLLHFLNLDLVFKFTLIFVAISVLLASQKIISKITLLALFLTLFGSILTLPKWSPKSFVPSRFADVSYVKTNPQLKQLYKLYSDQKDISYLFYEDGPNSSVATIHNKSTDSRSLYINGKSDADTKGDRSIRSMTALVPLSLAPKIGNVFIIGLGTGMSTGITTSFAENQQVRIAEMSEGVIKSLPLFEKWNFDLLNNNRDKFQTLQGDAYSILKSDNKKYDVIMSEPSNTWVTGVEKLYTKEFLQLASEKLTSDGVYSQWFPLFLMADSGFLSIIQNFQSIFKEVTVWQLPGYAVIILASKKPLKISADKLKSRFTQNPKAYKNIDKDSYLGILSQQLLPPSFAQVLAKRSKFWHSLEFPTLGYSSARAHFSNKMVNLNTLLQQYLNEPILVADINTQKYYWEQLPAAVVNNHFLKSMHEDLLKTPPYHSLAGLHYLKWWQHSPTNKAFKKDVKQLSQYDYLLSTKEKPLPEQTKEPKKDLYIQLWNRYLFLLNVLQPAQYRRLLPAIPENCQEKICFLIKLDLLKQIHFINNKTALSLVDSVKTQSTKNWIEQQFSQQFSQSSQ